MVKKIDINFNFFFFFSVGNITSRTREALLANISIGPVPPGTSGLVIQGEFRFCVMKRTMELTYKL